MDNYENENKGSGNYSGGDGSDNNNKGQDNNGNKGMPPRRQSVLFLLIASLITLVTMSYVMSNFGNETTKEITYDAFVQMLEEGKVDTVYMNSDKLEIIPVSDESGKDAANDLYAPVFDMFGSNSQKAQLTYYTGIAESNDVLTERLLKAGVHIDPEIPDNSGLLLSILLTYVLPILLLYFLISYGYKKIAGSGGPMGVGKSNAKVYVQKETGVTFADVAGVDEAKESLVEVVDFLHDPTKYTSIGAKLPKGALLVGPPGTGNTACQGCCR